MNNEDFGRLGTSCITTFVTICVLLENLFEMNCNCMENFLGSKTFWN